MHGGNVDCVIIISVVVACWANKVRTHNAAPRCTRTSTTPSRFPTFVLSNYVKCYNLLFILIMRTLFLQLDKNLKNECLKNTTFQHPLLSALNCLCLLETCTCSHAHCHSIISYSTPIFLSAHALNCTCNVFS